MSTGYFLVGCLCAGVAAGIYRIGLVPESIYVGLVAVGVWVDGAAMGIIESLGKPR